MSWLGEFCLFAIRRKKFWLMPVLLVLSLSGGFLILTQGSAIAPFIYALF